MTARTAGLIALSESVRNTGTELQSVGKKLHTLAEALTKEANAVGEENAKLKKELAAALAAAEKSKGNANAPLSLDLCLGIRAAANGAPFHRVNCCAGCGAGAGWNGGWVEGDGEAKSTLSKIASQAAIKAKSVSGVSKTESSKSKKSGDGAGAVAAAGSLLSSSHATKK